MVPRGLSLIMAFVVFVSACAPPALAAPRSRKPKKGKAAPTMLAQAPTKGPTGADDLTGDPTAEDVAPTTVPPLAGEVTRTTPATSESTAATAAATRPAHLGEVAARAPEAVPATELTAKSRVPGVTRVNARGEPVPELLRLYPNESKIIKVEGLKRVSITNQNIADVVIVSPDEIMVLPNLAGVGGRTSAYFWDKDGRKEIRVVVIGRTEESAIAEQIQRDINLAGITVDYINGRIILRGKVRNAAERQYALDIAGLYGNQILNILEVEGIALDPKEALIKLLNLPDVKVTVVNTALQASTSQLGAGGQVANTQQNLGQQPPQAGPTSVTPPLYVGASGPEVAQAGTISRPQTGGAPGQPGGQPGQTTLPQPPAPATVMVLLEGTVDDEQDRQRADEITRAFFNAAGVGPLGNAPAIVINHIEVARPMQILVEGMLVEFTNSNDKNVNFQWGTNQVSGLQPGAEIPSPAAQPAAGQFNGINFMETPVAQTLGQFTHTGGEASHSSFWPPFPFPMQRFTRMDPLLVNVNWLIRNNKAKLLANPKVVTRSGQEARIDAGGTIPVPVAAGLGAVGTQLVRFGTNMRITPTVDHRGNIDTRVAISISSPASLGSGSTNNRDTDTRVTVRDGQHIIVSGLIQDSEQLSVSKVPFFGDIPYVGRLFQTKSRNRVQNEVIVIVTPRLLDAVQKEEMFAKYGQMGPSDADLRAANKGAKPVVIGRAPASRVESTEQVASSALEQARRDTETRVAKLSTSTGAKPAESAVKTATIGEEPSLAERSKRVRDLFDKLRTQDAQKQAEQDASMIASAKAETPAPSKATRAPNLDTTRVPLMKTAPLPGPFGAPVKPAAAGPLGGDLVASSGVEQRPAEVVAPAPADESIERVSKKIDDLFDRLDQSLQSQGQ